MRDIIDEVSRWVEAGENGIAVATVLATYGSAPRGVGGKMAVGENGQIAGSVSGGCIEATIIEEGSRVSPGARPRVLHFETSDDNAWEVGLPCGGTIDILLEPLLADHAAFLAQRVAQNAHAYSITVIDGPEGRVGKKLSFDADGATVGSIDESVDEQLRALTRGMTEAGRRVKVEGMELFVESFAPQPTLAIVGGVHIAMALVRIAGALGYRTTIVDPRGTFGNEERFPAVDKLVRSWPEEAFSENEPTAETAVVVLTHDPKLDDPALVAALRSDAFYIGALGSSRTQSRRRERLARLGFSGEELARIHAPVGLDIGAATPEEIALAIAAEIVALRRDARPVLRPSYFAATLPADR